MSLIIQAEDIMNIHKKLVTAVTMSCVLLIPISVHAANELSTDISKAKDSVEKAAVSAETAAKDSAITAKIKSLFALEPNVKSLNISVTTNNGIVHLSGNVDTGLQADKVVEIAQGVSGVKDVNNSKLTVTSSESYTEDAFITAKVKGTIMRLSFDDKISSNHDLHVETTNGAVHIAGVVGNKKDVTTIKDALKEVSGVKSVHTDIKVK